MLSLPSPSLLAVAVIAALHSIPSYAQLSDQEGSDTQQADKELEVI